MGINKITLDKTHILCYTRVYKRIANEQQVISAPSISIINNLLTTVFRSIYSILESLLILRKCTRYENTSPLSRFL